MPAEAHRPRRRARRKVAILGVGAALAIILTTVEAGAADPAGGTITAAKPSLNWTGATFVAGAGLAANEVTGVEPVCPPAAADPGHVSCDFFALDVDVPSSYWASHPGAVSVSIRWSDYADHFDLGVLDQSGNLVGYQFSGDPETVVIPNAHGHYVVEVEPLLVPSTTNYFGSARITPAAPPPATAGPAVYRAVAVRGTDPDVPPQTVALKGRRSTLAIVGHQVGAVGGASDPKDGVVGAWSEIGVDRHGTVYESGRDYDGGPPWSPPTDVARAVVEVSRNGGRSWSTKFPDVAGVTTHPLQAESAMTLDQRYGRLFLLSLQELGYSRLSWTDDGGQTWSYGLPVQAGLQDRPYLLTAPAPPGFGLPLLDQTFPHLLYWCGNSVAYMACSHSVDGGRTFIQGPPLFTDQSSQGCSALSGRPATDTAGRFFIASANCDLPLEVESSTDGGQSFSEHVISKTMPSDGWGVNLTTDSAGNVYAAWQDLRYDLPYIAVSRDHGRTWGTPLMVAPPGVRHTQYVEIHAGAAGRVAVSFVGSTTSDGNDPHAPWRYYMTVTGDALASAPTFQSAIATMQSTHSDVISRGGCCGGVIDILDLTAEPGDHGRLWGSAAVSCFGSCTTNPKAPSSIDDIGYEVAIEQVSGPALLDPRARP